MNTRKIIQALAIAFAGSYYGCAQPAAGIKSATKEAALTGNEKTIAFYNCENFFDPADDPETDDQDFTPAGKYHYTQRIFEQKAHNLAVAVQNMPSKDGPAFIGLAEVENTAALDELVKQPEIARRNYKYVLRKGPDPRGINVAFLYNPGQFTVLYTESLPVDLAGLGGKSTTRDVLHVMGKMDADTIDVFVNHWPSRREGAAESAPKRAAAARTNRKALDKIIQRRQHAKVIVMGDLNDNPNDASINEVLGAKENANDVTKPDQLYNPWSAIYGRGEGTEAYKHQWNLFDQIMVSGELARENAKGLHFVKAEIFKPELLVDHYKGHEGEPHRSFAGTRWINGYSDHYPVIVYLSK